MARSFTPKDCHALMNELVREATGQKSITAVDASSFVSAGETVLATGMENVLNALSIVLNRLIIASRPYTAKFRIMDGEDVGAYSNRLRKISFYAQDALPDGSHNTDLYTNLAQAFTAGQNPDANNDPQSTKSQWEQHQAMPLEMNFGGQSVWQDCITMYEDQVKIALRNEEEFGRFVAGYLQEHANDIESQHEAFNRMVLLNRMAMNVDMASVMRGSVINLTAEFNAFYGTNYTTAQLKSTYLKEFLAFYVATIKEVSDYMTERSSRYHWPVTKTVDGVQYSILRHTPRDRQMLFMYAPLFRKAEALVLPEIFNPSYLDIDRQYEPVTFWQDSESRDSISLYPAVVETSGGNAGKQAKGSLVSLQSVVAFLCDRDAMAVQFQLDRADTTPLEARKHYRNVWNTYMKNAISDPTENSVLFIMEDAGISLNKSTTTITTSETLVATTVPAGGTVTWASSDTDIATVTSGGVVSKVAAGTCTISASVTVNGVTYTATCLVTCE